MVESPKIEDFHKQVDKKINNFPGLRAILMFILKLALYEFLPTPYKALAPKIIKSLVSNESLHQKIDEVLNDLVNQSITSM